MLENIARDKILELLTKNRKLRRKKFYNIDAWYTRPGDTANIKVYTISISKFHYMCLSKWTFKHFKHILFWPHSTQKFQKTKIDNLVRKSLRYQGNTVQLLPCILCCISNCGLYYKSFKILRYASVWSIIYNCNLHS